MMLDPRGPIVGRRTGGRSETKTPRLEPRPTETAIAPPIPTACGANERHLIELANGKLILSHIRNLTGNVCQPCPEGLGRTCGCSWASLGACSGSRHCPGRMPGVGHLPPGAISGEEDL